MSTPPDAPVLWQMRFSHYNEKARWALDQKRIPHRRRSLVPGAHALRAKRLWGGATTPVLELDGEFIGESSAILAELERRWPDHRLYPEDPEERNRALALEEHFDTELGPYCRGALFDAVLPYPREMMDATVGHFGAATRLVSRAVYPLTRRILQKRLVEDIGGGELCRRKTIEGLDRLEAELGGGENLVGGSFGVADLTAAALFSPLVSPPGYSYPLPDPWPPPWQQFRESLAGRDGYRWVEEMYRRHRGDSAAVAED